MRDEVVRRRFALGVPAESSNRTARIFARNTWRRFGRVVRRIEWRLVLQRITGLVRVSILTIGLPPNKRLQCVLNFQKNWQSALCAGCFCAPLDFALHSWWVLLSVFHFFLCSRRVATAAVVGASRSTSRAGCRRSVVMAVTAVRLRGLHVADSRTATSRGHRSVLLLDQPLRGNDCRGVPCVTERRMDFVAHTLHSSRA